MMTWNPCYYLFFLLLTYKSHTVQSIQCCAGDSSCTAKPVDCPSNVCFKLVFGKTSEYRGCMKDLISIVDYTNVSGRTSNDNNPPNGGSSNDQCQKINTQVDGMSLCKCTSNLCNSSSKYFNFSFLTLIMTVCSVYLFTGVLLA